MTDSIKYIIVDDEPIAGDIILNFCGHFPVLELAGVCKNALEARDILQRENVDLMFLDIQMPVLDGMSFLKTLKSPPLVIFTTAFKEHASQAFDVAAVDYLIKPFSFERFVVAINRITEKFNKRVLPEGIAETAKVNQEGIFLKADGRIYNIAFHEIIYAEANGNYTKIITQKDTISPVLTFAHLQSLLPKNDFIRVHRSFIVNKSKIRHIEGNVITIQDAQLPIGSNYREGFLNALGLISK